jgi:hypothetical protein
MDSETYEVVVADRNALGLIGLLLFAATLVVTITAAVAVSDYRGGDLQGQVRSVANLPSSPVTPMVAR